MTPEEFDEFCNEIIPQQLFHVDYNDMDDESGARLEEVILVSLIANNSSCLVHKPLQWFLDEYLTKFVDIQYKKEITTIELPNFNK